MTYEGSVDQIDGEMTKGGREVNDREKQCQIVPPRTSN